MRRMIGNHLRRRALLDPPVVSGAHLDEDALNAFIEGRFSEAESAPVIKHLIACAFCRNITAQLVRLDAEISATETLPAAPHQAQEERGRLHGFLQDMAARVLPSYDDGESVFAYHAPAEDFQRKEDASGNKKDAAQQESDPEKEPE